MIYFKMFITNKFREIKRPNIVVEGNGITLFDGLQIDKTIVEVCRCARLKLEAAAFPSGLYS